MLCGFVGGSFAGPPFASRPLFSESRSSCNPSPPRRNFTASSRHASVRMVTASDKDTATDTVLSHRAAQLLGYLRAHKSIFSPGLGFKATHLALYRKNDTGKSLVPEDELVTNAAMLPGVDVARLMLQIRDETLEHAKEQVLAVAPAMAEDATLANMLWFDLAYIFRVASYGIGVTSLNFIHEDNISMLKELYEEIGMPKVAVSTGINSLKEAVTSRVLDENLKQISSDCFDAISSRLVG
jgi:Phycobilisome protein